MNTMPVKYQRLYNVHDFLVVMYGCVDAARATVRSKADEAHVWRGTIRAIAATGSALPRGDCSSERQRRRVAMPAVRLAAGTRQATQTQGTGARGELRASGAHLSLRCTLQ